MIDPTTGELINEEPAKPSPSKNNALLSQYEDQNRSFAEDAKHVYRQVDINRAWVKGKPIDRSTVVEVDEINEADSQDIQTNLIFSTVQGLVPHYFAKNPDVSATPSRKVVKIDGDETEGPQYDQAKLLGETIEICVQSSVRSAGLKKKAKKAVRSSLVSRLGFVKAGYQSLTREHEPVLENKRLTLQDQLEQLAVTLDEINSGDTSGEELEARKIEYDAHLASVQQQMESVQEAQATIVSEGVVLDYIPMENMRWDSSVDADEMRNGDWIAQFTTMSTDEAKILAELSDDEDGKKRLSSWNKIKSEASKRNMDHSPDSDSDVDQTKSHGDANVMYVRVWERWDRKSNSRYSWVEGDTEFLEDPVPIKHVGGHFYPYFALGLYWLDGEMWPTSMVEMITPLQIEYDELRKQLKDHRRAALPYTIFDSTMVNGKDLQVSVTNAGARDIVGINANGQPLNQVFFPGPAVPLNPAMYDTGSIQYDLQLVSGLQDADRGAITTAKTATEANIQESGKANRTAEAVDEIEDWLTDIYSYCSNLCLMHMSIEKVYEIAGENAVWPETDEVRQRTINGFNLKIKAGSTGRPDKRVEIENWFSNLDSLMGLIQMVENKRELGVSDEDNPYYRIIEKTLKVLDQTEDVTTIMPKQKVTLIDRVMSELQQAADQLGLDSEQLLQLPSIAEYVQRKQGQQQQQ